MKYVPARARCMWSKSELARQPCYERLAKAQLLRQQCCNIECALKLLVNMTSTCLQCDNVISFVAIMAACYQINLKLPEASRALR